MRIGFVTQWFPPEPGTVVAAAIADGLAERGHHVDVLTGFPNYPTGRLQDGYPLKTYRKDERSPGVTVHRAPLFPSHDSSPLKRIANYLSFAMAASWVGRRHVPSPDAWLVYSSPATSAIPAFFATLRSEVPVHLLIEDLWPDSVTQSGFITSGTKSIVAAGLEKYCNWTYRHSSSIGVISPSMKRILTERGVDQEKIHYTPNWVEMREEPHPERPANLKEALGLPSGRLFMYAGNMGELQGLEPLVRAFLGVPSAHLVLIGSGVGRPRLESIVRTSHIPNVSFIDSQPTEVIGRYIDASDIQVVSLKDTRLLRATMPSKVQTSMAASKPILVHATGDVATLVKENRLGQTCYPGDWEGTVKAIGALTSCSNAELTEMGRRSRAVYEVEYAAGVGLDRIEHLMFGSPDQALSIP